jgi:tetratricopeptide (TPR) repeat protein
VSCISKRAFWIRTAALTLGAFVFATIIGCAGMQRIGTPGAKPTAAEPVVDPQWRKAYEHALGLMLANKLPEAERELTALAERQPGLAGPYANLGILYFREGRTADAVKVLEYAIALNPRPAYYNELGMVHRTEGRFEAAEQAYRRALELDPDYAFAHLNLGILYDLYLQQPDRALPHYERYRALAPGEAGTVEKWIADLKRRTSQAADRNKGERKG